MAISLCCLGYPQLLKLSHSTSSSSPSSPFPFCILFDVILHWRNTYKSSDCLEKKEVTWKSIFNRILDPIKDKRFVKTNHAARNLLTQSAALSQSVDIEEINEVTTEEDAAERRERMEISVANHYKQIKEDGKRSGEGKRNRPDKKFRASENRLKNGDYNGFSIH